MRTTIDLRPELHDKASSIARDTKRSLSETVNDLLASVLDPQTSPLISIDIERGLPVVHLGRIVTVDDVRELDDE